MKAVLRQHNESAYALLRMVVGFLFFCHGVVAVYFLLGEGTPYSPAWLYNTAGIVEFVTGALVLVGYQTRIAAFLASGQMAVAYFYRHQPDGLLPIQNDGELAALFEGAGADPSQRVVTYCGGGIAASNDAFVLAMLGYENVAIYDASMSEYAADPSLPLVAD